MNANGPTGDVWTEDHTIQRMQDLQPYKRHATDLMTNTTETTNKKGK